MVPGAVKFIVADVAFQWVALACNIALFVVIGLFLQATLEGAADAGIAIGVLGASAAAIVVRMVCQTAAQRMGRKAASCAKCSIRQQVYDKLAALGPAYSETVATAVAVQVSVEGTEQLESYFGQYLPQLFYALLAPLTLFVALSPVASRCRGAARVRAAHPRIHRLRAEDRAPHHAQLLGQLHRFGQHVSRSDPGAYDP